MTPEDDVSVVEKWRILADRIISLTHKGKLNWSESAMDDEFFAPIGKMLISLSKARERKPEGYANLIRIQITDSEGRIIESFDDEDIDPGQNDQYYEDLSNLHGLIQRRVSGADKILDELLSIMKREDD